MTIADHPYELEIHHRPNHFAGYTIQEAWGTGCHTIVYSLGKINITPNERRV